MTRVLVVDDEPQILRALRINLRVRDYEVHVAATGTEALEVAGRYPPDLVILDLGLPDLDGVEVIQGLRGWTKAPIIVLSGRADSVDKVEALDAGADDYVTKPFGVEELLARMRAAVRRTGTPEDLPRIRLGDLVVDLAAKRVIVNLTENALGYSPAGKPPLLTASALGDRVELRVVDRGPGIPEKDRDRMFVPFQRLGDTDNTTGVGLGLALSLGLTEAMGGTLTADDTPGGGLTMTVSVPAVTGPGYEPEPGQREREEVNGGAG